jgi:hypothetical protein
LGSSHLVMAHSLVEDCPVVATERTVAPPANTVAASFHPTPATQLNIELVPPCALAQLLTALRIDAVALYVTPRLPSLSSLSAGQCALTRLPGPTAPMMFPSESAEKYSSTTFRVAASGLC